MDNEKNSEVQMMPVVVHEYSEARWACIVKWLVAALMICLIIIGGMCFYLIRDYDYSSITVDSEDSGIANYMGANASGNINNGTSGSQDENTQE